MAAFGENKAQAQYEPFLMCDVTILFGSLSSEAFVLTMFDRIGQHVRASADAEEEVTS
jgi:hypothetical protein